MLVTHGHCGQHARAEHQRDRQQRGSAAARGYDSAWQGVRAGFAREHPLCQDCLEQKRVVPMQIVDHVIPLRAGGARLDPANLRSLCRPHHRAKTDQDVRRWPVPVRTRHEREDWSVA
jgi:5-methylcytosine-specific restriction protein A